MSQNVLTDNGFDRPTLAELMSKIGDDLSTVLGPVNRNPDSGIGQIIGVFAEALGVSYETAEEVFNSRFIRQASGVALDSLGDWKGIPRRGKTRTTTPVILYGISGSPVPAGALASYGNFNFALDADVTISTSNTTDIIFRINAPIAVGNVIAIRVMGVNYSVTAIAGDTPATLAAQLAALLSTAGSTSATPFDAEATGSDIQITSTNLSVGVSATIAGTTTAGKLTILSVGTPGSMTATVDGAIVVPANQLVTPVTGIAGWTGITNPIAASTGSDRESDTDYRHRLLTTDAASSGLATPSAIKRLVSAVPGVTAVSIVVNNTMAPIGSQPAKSFQVVVNGGTPADIARAIYTAGGAGIETYGTSSETYVDPDGEPHLIYFSRMTTTEYNVTAAVIFLNDEEELTPSVAQVIEQSIRSYFATLGLGDDIVVQRILVPIYQNTVGLAQVDLSFTNAGGAPVTPVNGMIEVPNTTTAVVNNVTVTGV